MERMKDEGRKKKNDFKWVRREMFGLKRTHKKKKREIRRRKHTRQTFFYNTTVHINELPNYTL